MSAKLEYLSMDFGDQMAHLSFHRANGVSLNDRIVHVGVNYRFGLPSILLSTDLTWAGTNRRTRAFVSGRAPLAISDCTEIGSSLHQGDTRWRLCGSTGSGARPPASSR
jgi:hypothetical protein